MQDGDGSFTFDFPVWLVGARRDGAFNVATGRAGENECLLVFTDVARARRCVQINGIGAARLRKLSNPRELSDFLRNQLPAQVSHVAFDAGGVGDAPPALVTTGELSDRIRALLPATHGR